MGAKQTKIEGTYLPATPTISADLNLPAAVDEQKYDCGTNIDMQDPRSPNICRTPLSVLSTNLQCVVAEEDNRVNHTESAIGQLRRKFFKGFTYNLNDPRSPGYLFNRSQISFDDSHDKILNLDDTFADLFAETQAQPVSTAKQMLNDGKSELPAKTEEVHNTNEIKLELPNIIDKEDDNLNRIEELSSTKIEEGKDLSDPDLLLHLTPTILHDEIDPRSPTIGVDRTPIMFNDDDDDTSESVLLESILATLSLNMSDISICSIGGGSPLKQNGEQNRNDRQGQLFRKITHKRMRRTRANEKIPLTTRRLAKDIQKSPQQRIFEDSENDHQNAVSGKSLKLKTKDAPDNGIKRTPLSCIKNSGTLHLRSANVPLKSLNARLEQSNNDSLLLE